MKMLLFTPDDGCTHDMGQLIREQYPKAPDEVAWNVEYLITHGECQMQLIDTGEWVDVVLVR